MTKQILDHGFIRIIDKMGNDNAIVQAARVSYGAGTKKVNEDRGLIRYLMQHSHTTPFEMCELKLHIRCPIFVARQWMRHRSGSFNEYSARYSVVPDEFYLPTDGYCTQSPSNKQGSADKIDEKNNERYITKYKILSEKSYELYNDLICNGIAREQARIGLHVGYYTEFYWKVNLHNLLHFIKLRADKHAQYEIRVYAEHISEIIKEWCPHAYEAFIDYVLEGVTLSKQQLAYLNAPQEAKPELNKRELETLQKLFTL
jgi:thymidylate synthase (FAD)